MLRPESVSDEENRVKELLRLQIDAVIADCGVPVLTQLVGLFASIKATVSFSI